MNKNNKAKALGNVALMSHIGITMIITIGGGIFLGKFIDDKLGTNAVFLAIFTILSVLAAFLNLYKITTQGFNKKGK